MPVIQVAASEATSRFVPLGVGKSVAIDLPADIKDVLVADPKIANAVIRSSRRVYMIGVTVGQTNIFFFDANGKQIAGFDIAVTRDLNGVRAALKQSLPEADIRIEGVGPDGIMLSGSANTAGESQQAFDMASRLVGDATKVVNGITVRGRDQVMLKVHGRRSAPRRHQAARHRSFRQLQLRHRRGELQPVQPVLGHRRRALRQFVRRLVQEHHRDAAGPWTAPASCARWPSRT